MKFYVYQVGTYGKIVKTKPNMLLMQYAQYYVYFKSL